MDTIIKRKPALALAAAGISAVAMGLTAAPAAADQEKLLVTLLGGKTITLTLNVPPGTPLSQIHLPTLGLGVAKIQVLNEPSAPPSTTTAPATGTTTQQTEAPQTSSSSAPQSPVGTGPQHNEHGTESSTRAHAPKTTPPGSAGADQGKAGQGGSPDDVIKSITGGATASKDTGNGGVPQASNPTFSLALPGPAPIGVPNFFIDQFRIPPFLLPIYQAAGIQYNVPWQVLAAINEIETNYGTNLSVSSAGAVGWMQFLPSTFKIYGVDGNGDGRKDPYNPVDAIFSTANYLHAAGASHNLRRAIFAYNHADWYVNSVLLRAKLIGGLPASLIGSLTGLVEGHFPVAARAVYADNITASEAKQRIHGANAARPDVGDPQRKHINIFAESGSPVIAVNDGRVVRMGHSDTLGHFLVLRDVYGNRYTYAHLGSIAKRYAVPKKRHVTRHKIARQLHLPHVPAPSQPATAGHQTGHGHNRAQGLLHKRSARSPKPPAQPRTGPTLTHAPRLFANPRRPAAFHNGGKQQIARMTATQPRALSHYFSIPVGLTRKDVVLRRLRPGARVIGGTILGHISKTSPSMAPHVSFGIRPAGKKAPHIDPKPILDGWKLLDSTAIYRASGKSALFSPNARDASIGQILLMSKEQLGRRVLADPRVQIYPCGRQDIAGGEIDRRVLAALEFLADSGLRPTVSSLKCGHGKITESGYVSEHWTGDAVDIAKINGIPITGHQGKGSITAFTIRRLLTLQGTMKPHQIISLMHFDGAPNTIVLPSHYNHIHIGYRPLYGGPNSLHAQALSILRPGQWNKLISHLGSLQLPKVPQGPSKYAIRGATHRGD
jgi:murein DD-endopeptidase MepM/ murein hydrolase activator NlpD